MKNSLQKILKDNPNTIKAEVAEEALDHKDPKAFFKDLLQHGCISGMVGNLIYYKDTHAFYDKHYAEIDISVSKKRHSNTWSKLISPPRPSYRSIRLFSEENNRMLS